MCSSPHLKRETYPVFQNVSFRVYLLKLVEIKMIKSRRVRWARNIARKRRRELHRGLWWESLKERGDWEKLNVWNNNWNRS
jgi:hypothetical protein